MGIYLAKLSGYIITISVISGLCADWNQYRGPDQNSISKETLNLKKFTSGPTILWRIETPNGFSSFSVADGNAFTLISRNIDGQPQEVCLAVDAETGKELWAQKQGKNSGQRHWELQNTSRAVIQEHLIIKVEMVLVVH